VLIGRRIAPTPTYHLCYSSSQLLKKQNALFLLLHAVGYEEYLHHNIETSNSQNCISTLMVAYFFLKVLLACVLVVVALLELLFFFLLFLVFFCLLVRGRIGRGRKER